MKRSILLLVSALLISVAGFSVSPEEPNDGMEPEEVVVVTWSENGVVIKTTEYPSYIAGLKISEMPETPVACDGYGYIFVGWSEQQISEPQSWAPVLYNDISEFPYVEKDVTYYAVFRSEATSAGGTYEMTDMLSGDAIGVHSSYTEWSDVYAGSGTTYAGYSKSTNSSITLRASDNKSGIINTTTMGNANRVEVEWYGSNTNGAQLGVYGSFSSFSSTSDLYNGTATLLGYISYDGSSTAMLSLSENYPYIGLRPEGSSTVNLTSVSITWSTPGAGGGDIIEYITECGGGNPSGGPSGTVGDLTWMLNDVELLIDGTGVIPDFSDDEGLPWTPYNQQIKSIKLNGDISSIGTFAFAGLTNLEVLNASYSLNYIGAYAFQNCQSLEIINLPVSEVVAVDGDAFSGCQTSNITVYVPEEVLNDFIGTEVWGSMNVVSNGSSGGLGKLLDSGECGSIYWEIYESGLLYLQGSGNMPYWTDYHNIPWDTYRSQIITVQVQEGVESLTTAAFSDCVQLSSVTLPSTICCIYDSTFYNCVALRSIVCNRGTPPSVNGEHAFENVTLTEISLTVPEGSGNTYRNYDYWKQMQIEEQGGGSSELEPYQVQYIFVNDTSISGFEPGLYTYNIVLPAGSETPRVSYMSGNSYQEVEIEQPTSPNSTAYVHVLIDGVRKATYTINFSCESNQVTISLTNDWTFIMLPCSALAGNWSYENITTTGDVIWARYDGEKRASGQSGWTTVNIEQSYYKDWGHIVRAQNGTAALTIDMPAEAGASSANIHLRTYDASLPQNANWNLIGNPYGANYDIKGLKAAGITAPIHVWNGVGYTTYNPEFDNYTLQPFEAFFVQLSGSEPETIMLSPEYIVNGNGGSSTGGNGVADEYGTLPGYFSVGEGVQVRFSRGNLQYQASTGIWQFAENQYDYVGELNANISESYNGWIDLFGWGTGNNPTLASQNTDDYSTFIDWGTNAISNGGNTGDLWRTLSNEEWSYICGARTNDDGSTTYACRPDATSKRGQATVCDVPGYVLLSDDFSFPEGLSFTATPNDWTTNVYSKSEWTLMENAGAVFFPCAGLRRGTALSNILSHGYYFANNEVTEAAIYCLYFREDFMNPEIHQTKNAGFSVRLVR